MSIHVSNMEHKFRISRLSPPFFYLFLIFGFHLASWVILYPFVQFPVLNIWELYSLINFELQFLFRITKKMRKTDILSVPRTYSIWRSSCSIRKLQVLFPIVKTDDVSQHFFLYVRCFLRLILIGQNLLVNILITDRTEISYIHRNVQSQINIILFMSNGCCKFFKTRCYPGYRV